MAAVHSTGVYLIRNTANGKVYVGSAAISFKDRWQDHRSALKRGRHVNKHLQSAWKKYGESAFEFVEIELCAPEECVPREQYWIDQFRAAQRKFGYNASPTAGSQLGFKFSPESVEKLAAANRGKVLSEEHRKKMSEGLREYYSDPENKEKLKRARREVYSRPEWLACQKKKMEDRYADPEERARHSEKVRAAYQRPEVRAKVGKAVREALAAKPGDKERRSAAMRAAWQNQEARANRVRCLREACQRPEVRAKNAIARKLRGPLNAESRAKIGVANRARVVSAETRAKMSRSAKARKKKPEPVSESPQE